MTVDLATRGASSPPRNLSWQARAACRNADPELFSPISGAESNLPGWAFEAQRRYCSHCPVVGHCRRYADALGVEALGVWGGQWRHTPKCDSMDLTVTDIPLSDEGRPRAPGELTEIQRTVLDVLTASPSRASQIADACGLSGVQVKTALPALAARGLIELQGRKWTRVKAAA